MKQCDHDLVDVAEATSVETVEVQRACMFRVHCQRHRRITPAALGAERWLSRYGHSGQHFVIEIARCRCFEGRICLQVGISSFGHAVQVLRLCSHYTG